jgi:hypothetical protein
MPCVAWGRKKGVNHGRNAQQEQEQEQEQQQQQEQEQHEQQTLAATHKTNATFLHRGELTS